MFSEKVDYLWHQMLMFTREYDDFSKNYLGSVLHHSPNAKETPDPDLRGFFDWVYSELFYACPTTLEFTGEIVYDLNGESL
jgi:hypothetical protein